MFLFRFIDSGIAPCRGPNPVNMPRKGYPAPLIVSPLSDEHTHTIIALHGRGSNAERFGLELLASADLKARLPTVKFIFPTASKRRSTVLKRVPISQWFDNYSLDDPGQRTDLQVDGLKETAEFLRGLIDAEARILGDHKKIILLGLSQGCASAIFTLLGGCFGDSRANALGAFVGMSGWPPFEQELCQILQLNDDISVGHDDKESEMQGKTNDSSDSDDDQITENDSSGDDSEADVGSNAGVIDDDPFSRNCSEDDDHNPFEEDEDTASLLIQTINHIRDILELPLIESDSCTSADSHSFELQHLKTPVFLGHGAEDPKVSAALGKRMSDILSRGLEMDVTWKSYETLGHWYRVEDEIEDILHFLSHHTGLTVEPASSIRRKEEQEDGP